MREPPLLVVMAKAPVCGAVKTRLAREIGAVAAASLARTLCAALLREMAQDARFRTILAVSPDTAVAARFASWPFRHPGTARRAVSGIAKKFNALNTFPRACFSRRLRAATISTPQNCAAGIVRIAQGRGGLGARMQRIFDVCGRGPLIVVGTDIPFVTRENIARAFRRLRGADAVLGPAEDGGYWLVGLRRRPTTLKPFENVRWSSPHALADTLANLRGRRVAFADTLFDIDTLADYRRFLRQRYR
jgi:uncharacterized protein